MHVLPCQPAARLGAASRQYLYTYLYTYCTPICTPQGAGASAAWALRQSLLEPQAATSAPPASAPPASAPPAAQAYIHLRTLRRQWRASLSRHPSIRA